MQDPKRRGAAKKAASEARSRYAKSAYVSNRAAAEAAAPQNNRRSVLNTLKRIGGKNPHLLRGIKVRSKRGMKYADGSPLQGAADQRENRILVNTGPRARFESQGRAKFVAAHELGHLNSKRLVGNPIRANIYTVASGINTNTGQVPRYDEGDLRADEVSDHTSPTEMYANDFAANLGEGDRYATPLMSQPPWVRRALRKAMILP